jgi:hypothetical protein
MYIHMHIYIYIYIYIHTHSQGREALDTIAPTADLITDHLIAIELGFWVLSSLFLVLPVLLFSFVFLAYLPVLFFLSSFPCPLFPVLLFLSSFSCPLSQSSFPDLFFLSSFSCPFFPVLFFLSYFPYIFYLSSFSCFLPLFVFCFVLSSTCLPFPYILFSYLY